MRTAFIPARGGSKRLPGKNTMKFQGRPLLAWTIDAAFEAGLFDRVVVSTDAPGIAEVAIGCGADVHARQADLAGDLVDVGDVLLSYLDELDADSVPDETVVLYATSPLRSASDIAATCNLLDQTCDFGVAVSVYPLPPHQALVLLDGSRARPFWPKLIDKNERDIGELVVDNGSTYAVRTSAFREHKTFFGPGLRVHVMPFTRSIDLDGPDDLMLLNAVYGEMNP